MLRILLIHWNEAEGKDRMKRLRKLGYRVDHQPTINPGIMRALRQQPPDAFVIDLSRLPSHGRDIALTIRQTRVLRGVPMVMVMGDSEKTKKIRRVLTEVVFANWSGIRSALKRAIVNPPGTDAPPPSVFAGYSGTPLPKKLGIKQDCIIALLNAPDNFRKILGELPAGVTFRENLDGAQLTLWFLRTAAELKKGIPSIARALGTGRLWMIWPKQSSGVQSDVTQNLVREKGLSHGLVDYKICAIDQTWSGLLFKHRALSHQEKSLPATRNRSMS